MASWYYSTNAAGKWSKFSATEGHTLESMHEVGTSTFSLPIGGKAYTIDLLQMTQRNDATGTTRNLKRVGPKGEETVRGGQWEWESAHGAFSPYPVEANSMIERTHKANGLHVTVKLALNAHDVAPVVVHLGHMHQYPADTPTQTRKIRRVEKAITHYPHQKILAPLTTPTPTHPPAPTPAPAAIVPAISTAAAPAGVKRSRSPGAAASLAAVAGKPVPFSSTVVGAPVPARANLGIRSWTTLNGTIMALAAHSPPTSVPLRVASFDLDDTLVCPKTEKKGKPVTFATSAADWRWLHPSVPARLKELHDQGYTLVIISNQGGVEKNPEKGNWFRTKVLALQDDAKVPISALAATHEDINRKPGPSMWEALRQQLFGAPFDIDTSKSFYVGDAAGRIGFDTLAHRAKDFSCSDRKFAFNNGVGFYTPEQWLLGDNREPHFTWEDFGPAELEVLASATHTRAGGYAKPPGTGPEIAVMVGYPGSGKSTFYRQFLAPHGYVWANRDTLKTKDKCMAVAKQALAEGKSVCVDNTSPDASERTALAALAKTVPGATARIFWMQTTKACAWHMNLVRANLGISKRVSSIAYNVFKGKFDEPNAAKEGFDEVVKVPVVLDFSNPPVVDGKKLSGDLMRKLFLETLS